MNLNLLDIKYSISDCILQFLYMHMTCDNSVWIGLPGCPEIKTPPLIRRTKLSQVRVYLHNIIERFHCVLYYYTLVT